MPGEGGILRILELEGCLNMPACGSARQNQCFPIHRLNIARNKDRRHPSIDAYSDADLRTRDANTGRSLMQLTSGEDARCSQHAVTLCPLSTWRLMRRCRAATLQHLSFRHQLWPGLISTTFPAIWKPGTWKDGGFSRISTLE